jgi:hypothetical protein
MLLGFKVNKYFVLKLLIFLAIAVQLPDLIGASDFVQQRIIITSNTILVAGITIIALYRAAYSKPLFSSATSRLFAYMFIILLSTSIFFTAVDHFIHINYVYNLFRLNYDQLGFLGAGFGILLLLNQPASFFSRYKDILIGLTPVIMLLFFSLMSFWPFDVLQRALHEDGPVESLQFVALLISAILSFLVALKLFNKKQLALAFIFTLLALVFLFISGEEISWGQRILNIATPERLNEINRQKEISVHNISMIEGLFFQGLLIASFYASFAFILKPYIAKKIGRWKADLFIPDYYYFFYFIPMLLYFKTQLIVKIPLKGELMELFFYTGIMVFIFENYKNNLLWKKDK